MRPSGNPPPTPRPALDAVEAVSVRVEGCRLIVEFGLGEPSVQPMALLQATSHALAEAWREYEAGLALLEAGEGEAAWRHLNAAVGRFDRCANFHLAEARALEALSDWDGAASAYERALHLTPFDIDTWTLLARALDAAGQGQAATRAIWRVAALSQGRAARDLHPDSGPMSSF